MNQAVCCTYVTVWTLLLIFCGICLIFENKVVLIFNVILPGGSCYSVFLLVSHSVVFYWCSGPVWIPGL